MEPARAWPDNTRTMTRTPKSPESQPLERPSRAVRWRTRLLALLVPLVAIGAAFALLTLRTEADHARQAQVEFTELAAEANTGDALRWRATAERRVSRKLAADARALHTRVDSHFARLAVLDADNRDDLARVAERFRVYEDALADQFRLFARQDLSQAAAVGKWRLDPASAALERKLAAVSAGESAEARATTRRANAGMALSLGLGALALVLVLWLLDRSRRRVAEDRAARLQHEARHDPLTGLGNRRKLMRDLAHELGLARKGASRRLIMLDLDGFKAYNDLFGHPEGDLLLQRLSAKLAEAVAGCGEAYRLGGDEFCVLLTCDAAATSALEADCVDALSEDGAGFRVRASHGSVGLPAEAATPSAALRLVDERMYSSKSGRRSSAKQQARDLALRVLSEQLPDLHEHASNVAELARGVATRLGLEGGALWDLVHAAELHDIGKLAVPAAILDKPGPLDAAEWASVRRHTALGEGILGAAPALGSVAALVRSSHERFDGSGYPDGLAGDAIPLASRIVFVCDAFDAMTSTRSYKVAIGEEAALAELRRAAGTQFDPLVVEAFCAELAALRARPAAARVEAAA